MTTYRLTKQELGAVNGALRQYIARWQNPKRRRQPTASYYAAIRALKKLTGKVPVRTST
ncbi:MAG TPA: hypothetical protein VFA43_21395 [Gemmatimonadaceae bacterium]|nr:hypothetical protein [Gemmatimonadaceae bacterium]